jgi:hypothetical protein
VKALRRILIVMAVTIGVIFIIVDWIAPVAFSFYAARTALPITRVVPTDLTDSTVSESPGEELSCFGYVFKVPWNDLDQTQSRLYPAGNSVKTKVDLHFHSGLRLLVTAIPPNEWVNGLGEQMNVSRQSIRSSLGSTDYTLVRSIYEFTPDSMNHWALSPRVHAREEFLLILKSIAMLKSANTGLFNIHNESFKGFQEGNPLVRQDGIALQLFSDQGSIEFIFFQKNYQRSVGLTQPEINCIIHSLQRVSQSVSLQQRKTYLNVTNFHAGWQRIISSTFLLIRLPSAAPSDSEA